MIFFLSSHSQSPSNAKSATTTDLKNGGTSLLERALGPGQMKMNVYPDATALGAQDATNVTQRLQWHLSRELPLHGHKATAQHAISEKELLRFIKTHFENDAESRSELASVIAARSGGIVAEDGWWSWMHRAPLSTPVCELMRDFHCDGLLDWSRVPSSALADSYMQIIVTSGVGSKAMLHEGEDTDWLQSLHRDVFHDWSLRGLRHFFVPKVDTLLVGCIGRKRIVMLPPHAMTPGPIFCCEGHADSWCCPSSQIRCIRRKSRERGWMALERHALEVGGAVFTICQDTYCYIPAGWWHIVRPLDDFTAILTPSFIQGCWSEIAFEESTGN
jgi:hypothetical protein